MPVSSTNFKKRQKITENDKHNYERRESQLNKLLKKPEKTQQTESVDGKNL